MKNNQYNLLNSSRVRLVEKLRIVFLSFFMLVIFPVSSEADIEQKLNYIFAICEEVIDENTIKVDILGMKRNIRLIGVQVRKGGFLQKIKKAMGYGAVQYLKENVKGKELFVEFDESWMQQGQKVLKGFVHLKKEGTFINIEMVKLGYAKVDEKGNYKFKNKFEEAAKGIK